MERDECLTKILASVGQFLVLNPRSKKTVLGKKISNPPSPVSPLPLSAWPSTKQVHISLLLNALDISSASCLSTSSRSNGSFSFRFPGSLVSLCNAKLRRGHQSKESRTVKTPVTRSYTLPFSKHSISLSCKQYSARNAMLNEHNGCSSLETRAALGILNIDSGDMRQYFARVWHNHRDKKKKKDSVCVCGWGVILSQDFKQGHRRNTHDSLNSGYREYAIKITLRRLIRAIWIINACVYMAL